MTKKVIYPILISLLKSYGAKKIGVFGSFSRRDINPESDLDILVEFNERKSLLELVKIELILSEKIGIKVDLLTEKFISPYLIDRIKSEAEQIYG